jgi:hypothetical protein
MLVPIAFMLHCLPQALKEVSKLNYRILHLTRNLRAADGGAAAAAAPTKA